MVWIRDFDTRSFVLETKIEDHWDVNTKASWVVNKAKMRAALKLEFGENDFEVKIQNFVDIGTKPFSIIAYHNDFFAQARNAFVIGCYYASLTAACALGERILNHLIIDLRDDFKHTPQYKQIYRKSSFDNWDAAIGVLKAWKVLLPDVSEEFKKLQALRHRSIHFNQETYVNLRRDALAALHHIRCIIEQQFGWFCKQPWYIEGTQGHQFIKRSFESNPFVRRYFLPQCPLVGPLFAINFDANHNAQFIDREDYGSGVWTDEEFKELFNIRKPDDVVKAPTR